MSKYYYHGLGEACYCFDTLEKLKGILTTGGIKCKKLLGLPNIYEGNCNGMDYVSVCKKFPDSDYQKITMYEQAFPLYVQNSFCLIISDQIEAIRPILIPISTGLERKIAMKKVANSNERFSDMFDEWQVKEQIPLSSIIGIGIPIQWVQYHWTDCKKLERLGEIVAIAERLGLDIVDTNNPHFVEDYEAEKLRKEEPQPSK